MQCLLELVLLIFTYGKLLFDGQSHMQYNAVIKQAKANNEQTRVELGNHKLTVHLALNVLQNTPAKGVAFLL